MSSSSHPQKIKPYIPKKLSIDSRLTYSTFLKNKPKMSSHFIFNNSTSTLSELHEHPRTLLKAIKQLKHVHFLDLGKFFISKVVTNLSYMISSAKKMSRAHSLSSINSQNIEGGPLKIFKMWSKYIYRLKALTDSTDRNYFYSILNERRYCSHFMKERFRSVLFRYQNRLESLQITFRHNTFFERLKFEEYPISIKKLSFFGGIFQNPVSPMASLEQFKNLKVLELNFDLKSSPEFINSLISLLPRVSHLESLSLFSPLGPFPRLKENFQSLKILTNLKCIKIQACNLAISHSKALLKALMELPLSALELKVIIENPKEVNLIFKLLDRLTQLTSLKLHVYHRNIFKSSKIQKVFTKIDNLQNLKHLSLKIKTLEAVLNIVPIEIIQLPFANLFTKPTPLESFRIESNHIKISNEAFLGLLRSLQKQADSLKKIKLAIGEVLLDQKEFKQFLKLFSKIHKDARVLRFSMLGMYNKSHFMKIVESIGPMKYLRSFGLGKFYMRVTKKAFWEGVKKILYKRGLEKFKCDTSKDFREKVLNFARTSSGINWRILKKKNPALVTIPESITFLFENLWEH